MAGVCGQTVENGCNSLLMPVCVSVGGGGGCMGVECATMGTFC